MTAVFETGHAYGITGAYGKEILIHIGLETVELAGKGFAPKVKQGQEVVAGQVICEVDLEYLKNAYVRSEIMLLFPKLTGHEIEFSDYGPVEKGKTVVGKFR